MKENRRSFLKKASLLAGATAAFHTLPASILRAIAIEAEEGSTYLDAEHVVFLMQENRSFDHCYGTLRGVRGFNDPRAIQQDNGLPIWIQTNAKGDHYAPFHLDIVNTKATWMGSLPHGWKDMVAARNNGKLDTWLEAKKAGNPNYQHMPLTLGYYERKDIPFYYAFADAFTVCDQHFCSSLTGTSANRSYFWSGAIRENPHDPNTVAHVDNGQINYKDISWTTYPERLEQAGIDWKVYQNELSLPVGLTDEQEDWLANFTDNNLEFYKQYQVRFHAAHRRHLKTEAERIRHELKSFSTAHENYKGLQEKLIQIERDLDKYSSENFSKLDDFTKSIHEKAFVTNTADPAYHELETIHFTDERKEKTVNVPKGDIFYQFRKDVEADQLPTISWLVAPCRFSDHPGSPWYGAWYVSEALDILTANPEIWKKTIFVLTYDENDGYFDHVPPFVPPMSQRPYSGKVPQDMDTQVEYVTAEQEKIRTGDPNATLDSPIGLGFRVPMVIASPWSKGGWVNSEVFDHTSTLQFLEHFIEQKTGKKVFEPNISSWRRLVCGDLTSVFRPASGQGHPQLEPVERNAYVERIYSAKNKVLPGNYSVIAPDQLPQSPNNPVLELYLPKQEIGTKPACSLPYDVDVNAKIDRETLEIVIHFELQGKLPTRKPIGIPLIARTYGTYKDSNNITGVWNFAVRSGEPIEYRWKLNNFKAGNFQIDIHGPNGFYRSFRGDISNDYKSNFTRVNQKSKEQILILDFSPCHGEYIIRDLSYGRKPISHNASSSSFINLDLTDSDGWYDLEIKSTARDGSALRLAGHLETGKSSITDPLMGLGKNSKMNF